MAETNILQSVKDYCRITLDSGVTAYDDELISHINTVLMELNRMGVGPDGGFALVDGTETWDQVVPDNVKYPGIIDYIKIKTRVLFDPDAFSSNAMQSTEKVLQEIEWTLNYIADAERSGILH